VSQPCNTGSDVKLKGTIDPALNEFWVGNPWKIFKENNLSCFERNRLYLYVPGGAFLDVSHVSGADNDGDSRSAVAVDLDHDGRLDLALRQVGGGPLVLYRNQAASGRFLEITLRGTKGHPSAIGGRVVAKIGDRQVVRECYPLNSFRSQAPRTIHIGLGDAEKVDELTIHWPSGAIETLRDIAGDARMTIREGDATQ
jgi:enediyne biosynthesis protein E4